MPDDELHEAVQTLEAIRRQVWSSKTAIESALNGAFRAITTHLGPMSRGAVPAQVSQALPVHQIAMQRAAGTMRDTADAALATEVAALTDLIPVLDPVVPDTVRYADSSHLRIAPMSVTIRTPEQGEGPTCSFHSTMAAISQVKGRMVLRSVQRDAHESHVVVSVGGEKYVVDERLPMYPDDDILVFGGSDDDSVLIAYLEKAWAHRRGGYETMGAYPADVFSWFTGRPAEFDAIANLSSSELRRLATDPGTPLVASHRLERPQRRPTSVERRTHDLADRYQVADAGAH